MKLKRSFFLIFIFIFSLVSFNVIAQSSNVLIVEITDTIDQSTTGLLKESMQKAEIKNSEAIILLLNTPGGSLQQTFDIADMIHSSQIPVIGYVYPSGSTAWSAGTFILMSTHIAAMADHTIIGSCQPVEVGIEGTRVINDSKTINALVEWIQVRANMYGRNETLAGEFITINRNVNANLAKSYGVIEYVSPSIDQLLDNIDGTNVTTSAGNVTLHTKDAEQIWQSPSFKIQILKIVSNPVFTSLLLMLGIFALIFGISSPGFGAEVFGVIAILLSLVGSGFAISTLSIIFIIIGGLLLIIEIFVTPGFGVIGIGGIICLAIGSIFLVPSYPNREWLISMEYMETAMIISLVVIVLIAIFFVFLLYKVLQIRNKKKAVGIFIGEKARTIDRITPGKPGYVRFKGEYWQARSDTTIEQDTTVIIVDKDESVLIVKPKER
ncbi:membrane-bound serine protease (ClpP class) [Thermoplasmatales archaeon SCGC AB-539-N05]|nr:membrane-bound serine protease (ClpP class) [Thermoplasmatales archaeon SCGC AB-539-N05]